MGLESAKKERRRVADYPSTSLLTLEEIVMTVGSAAAGSTTY